MEVRIVAGIQFSQHAQEMMKERNILEEWVVRTIQKPDRVELGSDTNDHLIKAIPEHGGRFLRIVVNTQAEPKRAITLFFDRRLGRRQ
ncbi:MAG: DUF4258 domain-containing protein [Elusimicrobia bacterium]|nr:DUF4258 domain-containing protein [Elusimicrobiota bacterium]